MVDEIMGIKKAGRTCLSPRERAVMMGKIMPKPIMASTIKIKRKNPNTIMMTAYSVSIPNFFITSSLSAEFVMRTILSPELRIVLPLGII